MYLRRACETDIDAIMEVLEGGKAALKALGIDQWQGGYPHRSNIEEDVARGESYVLVDEEGNAETVLATAMISLQGERIYDAIEGGAWLTSTNSSNPRYGVLHRVAVRANCQGRGIGSEFLRQAEAFLRECGAESARIDTHPGNAVMIRLLEKCGYTRCGIVFITHAEDGIPDRFAYEKLLG